MCRKNRTTYRVTRFRDRHNPTYTHAVVYYTPEGKRKREKFRTKAAAQQFADSRNAEIAIIGAQAQSMTDSQRMEAAKCLKTLPAGYSLTQAVNELAERVAKQSRTVSVETAAQDLIDAKKAAETARSKSPRYVLELTSQLRPFREAYGSRPIAAIDADEIAEWISRRSQSPVSRNNARRYLGLLWSHAIRKKWATENPVKQTQAEETDSPPTGVLTPEAMRYIFATASEKFPGMIAAIALQAFAGLRDAEVRRLAWEDVNLEDGHITIAGAKAKTRTRRTVDIQPNLKAFLAPLNARTGAIVGSTYRIHFSHLRKIVVENGYEWPTNALRHSFVSYRLSASGDENRTALEAGHNVEMLHRHYKGLVTKKAAQAWWEIRPENAQAGNVVVMPATAAQGKSSNATTCG